MGVRLKSVAALEIMKIANVRVMTDRPEIPKTRTRRLLGANVAYTKK
jgi:hypothetical protein